MKNTTPSKMQKIAENVLDYWYTLEFLSQDTLPGLSYEEQRKNDEAVKAASVRSGGPQSVAAEKSEPKVLKLITPVASGDEIACFSLQLTPEGCYIEKTFSLSPMIWAISRLEKAKGKSLVQYLSHETYRTEVEAYDGQLKQWNCGTQNGTQDKPAGASALQIADFFRQLWDEYIKGALEVDYELSCMMMYQVFKDENEQERYEDDDYLGLGRNFFAEDLKLVLSGIQTGRPDSCRPRCSRRQ